MLYRRPGGTEWEPLHLDTAMDMIADRVIDARRKGWQSEYDGRRTRRTMAPGFASLGGATLDNELPDQEAVHRAGRDPDRESGAEDMTLLHSSRSGKAFGRGGATTFQQDLANSDCILIEGSNMAEAHPVGFQWVMEAKKRGAKIIHVDPRFSRTSAVAHLHVPIRAGADIAFVGGLINYVLQNEKYFEEYVPVVHERLGDHHGGLPGHRDPDGLFLGFNPSTRPTTRQRRALPERQRGSRQRGPGSGRRPDAGREGGVARRGARIGRRGRGHLAGHRRDAAGPALRVQILKRHFARYTPEMVAEVAGVPEDQFLEVARAIRRIRAGTGPRRRVQPGWTQHTVGVQYIRTAAILQTLLGNMGRPGGGILALRGHASIEGSTDIPTLFDLPPGYLPMPFANGNDSLDRYVRHRKAWTRASGPTPGTDMVSLLKAYWRDAATAENDFCYDYLPRLTGSHST